MKLSYRQEMLLDSFVDKKLDNVLTENAYQEYFRAHCKKYGVKSPFQIKDLATRKRFFNELKTGWAKEKAKMK